MAAARPIAQLGAAAAAAAASTPGCFDAAQSGGSLWTAARADERSVAVAHAPLSGSGTVGSLHALLLLPEPVTAVQLGVPTAAAGAAAAASGSAVLLIVDSSCRVWAFRLQPPQGPAAAEPTRVTADAAAAVAVPVAQQQCPARHQLAAAVAWEHLCYAWDPAAAAQQPVGGSGRSSRTHSAAGADGTPGVAALSLSRLQAALHQQKQQPLLVHSVARWVCRPQQAAAIGGPAVAEPAPAIPADAVAAAYVSLATADDSSSSDAASLPRLACSSRAEVRPSSSSSSICGSSSGAGGPVGYLAVATAGGQLLALPVGLPIDGSAGVYPSAPAGSRMPLAVCWNSSGGMHFLPTTAGVGGSSSGTDAAWLLLLAASGRLMPAAAAGLGSSPAVTIAAGTVGGSGGAPAGSSQAGSNTEGLFTAAVQLVGARSAAAAGSSFFYLPSGASNGGSGLRCLDASSGLLAGAAAVELQCDAGQPCLLAATAPASPGSKQAEQLVLLTKQGALLAMPCPSSCGRASLTDASTSKPLSMRQLEQSIQGLLGGIAELSERQKVLEQQQLLLDGSIAGLAAAIPAAQGAAAARGAGPTGARRGLHCTLRPLALRSQALGGGSYGEGGGDVLALEVCLDNRSGLPLTGAWSLLVTHNSSSSSSVAFAAPLGSLPAGAEWRHECQVPLPAASSSASAATGQLRVLLCRHGSGSGSGGSPSSSCVLLLHSVRLHALHLLLLRGNSRHGSQQAPAGSISGDGGAPQLQVSMVLQLPQTLCGAQPAASTLLQQLLSLGLSSRTWQQLALELQQAAGLPCPAFSLLLPPRQQQSNSSSSSSVTAAGVSLSARLLPAAPHSGAASHWLLQVAASAADPAALLACHQDLCRCSLQLPSVAAEQQQQQQQPPPWLRLPDGSVLLRPGIDSSGAPYASAQVAAAAAVDEATLEQVLVKLRQLKAEAMQLRQAGITGPQQGGEAAQQQAARRQRAAELQRVALAARQQLPPVLIA